MLNSNTDIMVTSGAVSAGKYDFIPEVIKTFKLSNYFKSVAIRPGKPILFAKIKNNQKAIFGLPGNPMSSALKLPIFTKPMRVMSNLFAKSMARLVGAPTPTIIPILVIRTF